MQIRTYATKLIADAIRTQKTLTVHTFKKFTVVRNSNKQTAVPSSFVARMIEGGETSLRCLSFGKTIVLWDVKA